nr:MAG TPA: hypothetical protein [Caudoviricetes sp.]
MNFYKISLYITYRLILCKCKTKLKYISVTILRK